MMIYSIAAVLLLYVNLVFGQSMLGLNQGEICKGNGDTIWKCEYLKNCPQVGDFRRNRPTICSFKGIEPIICCPPSIADNRPTVSPTNNLQTNGNAAKKCIEYNKKHCMTFTIEGRSGIDRNDNDNGEEVDRKPPVLGKPDYDGEMKVFGGRSAKAKQHRHMVLIGYGQANAKSWNCGGSLISTNWVLSAAHCANPFGQGPARWARVGDLDISTTNEDARPQERLIVQRIIYPEYKEPAVYHDIALFKLDSDVALNDWVAPVCLHTDNEIPATKATVTGWGRLDFVGDVSPQLQEADITLVSGTECVTLYENNKDNKIPEGIKPNTMVCAGEKEGGKDACSGDSGGPLVIQMENRCLKTQVGITSFGRECGLPNTPGVYTRVSNYIAWIESIVWPTKGINQI